MVRVAQDLKQVRRMPTAGALDVIGVDGAAGEGGDRFIEQSPLVDPVRMHGHGDIVLLGHAEHAVDDRGRRAEVLVDLQARRASFDGAP